MYKNKKINVRIALLLILAIFLSSPFIFLETIQSHNEAKAVNEKDIRSANSIWSYTTGDLVNSLATSSDGQYIVAGGHDNKTYLFSKDSSTPLWNYTTGGWVRSVAISSDGQYIAVGSGTPFGDGNLYLFNKTSSTPLWSFTRTVTSYTVAISSDGQYIVAGFYNKIYLFNRDSSSPLWSAEMEGGADVVVSVAISSDGQYIAAGGHGDKVYLFNRDSYAHSFGIPLWNYTAGALISSVAISSNGQYIAVGSYDDKVYLFDNASSTPLWNYTTGDDVRSVAISSDGQYIAAGSMDDKVYLFDNASSTPLWNYTAVGKVNSVAISSDGQHITAGSGDNKVYLFDKASSTPLWSYTTGGNVNSVAISSDGQYIAAGSHDDKIYLFDNEPFPFTLSTDADVPDLDGIFSLNWTVSSGATNYSVYQYSSFITEINNSLTLLADEITDLSSYLSGYSDGTYYFIVVANNTYGATLSNCISVVVGLLPGSFMLSSNAGDPDYDGLFTLSWTTSSGASNYSLYRYANFITEINGSLTLLEKEITDLSSGLTGYSNGTYYFIVVAHNQMGNTSSNCISVIVEITQLRIITPTISSSWESGTSQSISWSSIGSISNIKLELYRNDVFVMEIISSTANDGEVSWVVSSELVSSDDYQIKIIDVSDASIFAYSDYFEIENTSTTEPPGIPGYNVLLLIATLGSIMALIIKKRSKSMK